MDLENLQRAAAQFIARRDWLVLTSIDADGSPTLSYMPFAVVDSGLGIVASRLAAHTANLLARRPAAAILIDEAGATSDAYARPRLSIDVSVVPLARGSAEADAVWSKLARRHGETVAILRGLPDFEAIALAPIRGRLILGFAAAHDLDAHALAAALGSNESC